MGVTVAVTRVALNTGTGTQDITTTDLGGLTPKAVRLFVTRAITDGAAADGAGWYWGASDGTNEIAGAYEAQHAQATMDIQSNQDTTANRILTIYDGTADSAVEATIDFDSFITDGVRINITDAPAAAYLLVVEFWAGTDLTANVGRLDLGSVANAAIDITTVGFEADVVLTAWNNTLDQGALSMGIIHNDRGGTVTQRCIAHSNRNAFGVSNDWAVMRAGDCLAKIQGAGTLDYNVTAGSFDSSGFTATLGNSRSPSNADIAWLALRFGTSPVISSKVYTYSTPTATGSNTDSAPGFEPQFVLYLASRTAVADTIEGDADGGSVGLVTVDTDDLYTQSVGDEDAAADSNTQSLSDNILNLPTHTGASGQEAGFTSFGGTGVTWNWTAVDATARQWAALAIGINAVAGAGQPFMARLQGIPGMKNTGRQGW